MRKRCAHKEHRYAHHQVAEIFHRDKKAVGIVLREKRHSIGLRPEEAWLEDLNLKKVIERNGGRCKRSEQDGYPAEKRLGRRDPGMNTDTKNHVEGSDR